MPYFRKPSASFMLFLVLGLLTNLLLSACNSNSEVASPTVLKEAATIAPGLTASSSVPVTATASVAATPTLILSSGLTKGMLKEIFPPLANLPDAKAFRINDGFSTQGYTSKIYYTLERQGNQFEGEGVFKLALSYAGGPGEAIKPIIIPLDIAQQFLKLLAETPVEEGSYKGSPIATTTDNFPNLELIIETNFGTVRIFSRSQQPNFFPWSIFFANREFTATNADPFKAFSLFKPYFKKETLKDLENKQQAAPKVSPTAMPTPPAPSQVKESTLTLIYSILSQPGQTPDVSSTTYSPDIKNQINALALSPDGKTFVTGTRGAPAKDNGEVKLWNFSDGKLIRTFQGHKAEVTAVAFSPDGRYLASGSGNLMYRVEDNSVRLWEVASGKELIRLNQHTEAITALAFTPDGKMLASASQDRTIRLWEMPSGKPLGLLKGKVPEFYEFYALAISPDGKRLAAAGSGDSESKHYPVKLWDIATGQELANLKGHTAPLHSLAFSADGRTLASAGDDNFIKLWDVSANSLKERATLTCPSGGATALSFSPESKTLAISHNNGLLSLWESATGKETSNTLAQNFSGPFFLSFSRDGKFILSAHQIDTALKLWELK